MNSSYSERPVVEIGRAYPGGLVIDEHGLFVKKTVGVMEKANTGPAGFFEIKKHRQIDQQVVGLVRDQDAHIHPAQACQLQGVDDGIAGNEIGRHDDQLVGRLLHSGPQLRNEQLHLPVLTVGFFFR